MRVTVSRVVPMRLAISWLCGAPERDAPVLQPATFLARHVQDHARHAPVDVEQRERRDLVVGLAQARRQHLDERDRDREVVPDHALEVGAMERQQVALLDRDRRCRARLVVEQRISPKKSPGPSMLRMISRPSSPRIVTLMRPATIVKKKSPSSFSKKTTVSLG
jgi:hypothetical protein